ncbi:uncharacterized protein LOC111639475 [Centruroides sculpturatus]|uniref:uncharacterized protein LOC111639475 n=1 Tax=Centruroides sculpturatus TaxID=218467 RepID=UPI000C6E9648|nr:uncharacterized protein LOC111639475 [Centruroides sculpturatus]XP_023241224.1 uncharacterized protein LOC111639475 [Centruroides sculpturatus]
MSSLCFVCELPILTHQTWGNWPTIIENQTEEQEQEPVDLGTRGSTYHEDCLNCETCGFRLTGSNFQRARRYKDKIYCSLHYADVSGLVSGEEFMQKLREFKRQSLGCAEARRKSSTTLQFPTPVQACPGNGSCPSYSHFVKPTPGYWIECSGSNSLNKNPSDSSNSGNVTITVNKLTKTGSIDGYNFELMSLEEETYDKYFYGTEHWNYFTNDEALGPVILSIKQENINNRDQFR